MFSFFDKVLLKYQCGFRKGFSTQQYPLALFEKWKRPIDNGEPFGALIINLSKAFYCHDNKLFIVKLNAYGSNLSALKLVYDYTSYIKLASFVYILRCRQKKMLKKLSDLE